MVMPREWLRGAGTAVFLMLAVAVAVGCGEQRPTATSPAPSPIDGACNSHITATSHSVSRVPAVPAHIHSSAHIHAYS